MPVSKHANPLYIGTHVYIGTYRKRYVVIDNESQEMWAKEYFKTEGEARGFIEVNGFVLIMEEIKPWRSLDDPPPVDPALKRLRNRKSYKMFSMLGHLMQDPKAAQVLLVMHQQLDERKMYGCHRNSVYAKESLDQVIKDLKLA